MKYIYDEKFGIIEYDGNTIKLTKQENRIFKIFIENKKLTHEEISDEIYGGEAYLYTTNAIRKQVENINKKIKPIAHIKNMRGFGYILIEGGKD